MTVEAADIVNDLIRRAAGKDRFLVAIAGPPGSGKSTFADHLAQALLNRGEATQVVPMDGFHMDDRLLRDRDLLARKGAPETFDVRGLIDILRAVRTAEEDVLVPVFDRSRELAIAAARAVTRQHRFVLVEGNYLLLREGPWARLDGLFDYSILLSPPVDVLEQRLMARWRNLGLEVEAARRKVQENDLPNGELVRTRSRRASRVIPAE